MPKVYNLFLFFALAASSLVLLTTQYVFFALIPVLALPVFWAFFKYPLLPYYLIIFLVPFSAYRGLGGAYDYVTISKFAGAALMLVVGFHVLFRKGDPVPLGSIFWKWFAFFGVVNLIAALVSPYFPMPFDDLRKLMTAYVVFGTTIFLLNRVNYERWLVNVLLASVSISSFLSVIGYLFDIEMFAMDVTAKSLKRAIGAAGNPNHFACMVIFAIPLVIHRIVFAQTAAVRRFSVFLFALNVLAVVFTFSRSGAAVLGVVLLLSSPRLIKKLKPRQFGAVLASFMATAVIIMACIPAAYWQRQFSVVQPGDPSISRRVSYLDVAWDMFRETPWLGQGPGVFNLVYAGSVQALAHGSKEPSGRDAHNTYIEVGTGSGLVGLVLFGVIIAVCFRNFHVAAQSFSAQGDEAMASLTRAYWLSFFSMLLYFFMLSSVTHKYFWMALALSQVAVNLAAKDTPPATSHG